MKSRSKKIILLFFTFLAIGGAFFLLLKQKKEVQIVKVAEIKKVEVPKEIMDTDSDGDGLKDWEETLWGLDSRNKDTNGDGIPDAEEVKNRMKKIDSSDSSEDDLTKNQYATDTETSLISKKLFAEYINLKQSGNLNEETINATANNLINDELKNKKPVQYYFAKDIKTFPAGDKNLLKKYGNSFASIKTKYLNQFLKNPLMSETGTDSVENPEFLKNFILVSGIYKNMAIELSKLSVPKDLVDVQTDVLNNYMASSDGLKGIGELLTDPVMGMIGTQRHMEAEKMDKQLLKAIAENLFNNGVVFSENEPGDFWNNL